MFERMLILPTFVLLVVGLLSAPVVEAAAADRSGPVEIVADRLEADQASRTLIFSGDTVARQDDVTIRADRLIVTYTTGDQEIEEVIAEGRVRIVQGERTATGDRAVFRRADGLIVLTGSPRVSEGGSFVQGNQITLYLAEERSVVSGGSDGRVNAVFSPRDKEAKP